MRAVLRDLCVSLTCADPTVSPMEQAILTVVREKRKSRHVHEAKFIRWLSVSMASSKMDSEKRRLVFSGRMAPTLGWRYFVV